MICKFKKQSILSVLLIIITFIIIQPISAQAEGFDVEAESAILVDKETGTILFNKNSEVALPPASMTKMMTEYLVWEAIEAGDISWDTLTKISDYSYSISANTSFSGVGLYQDVDYTVQSLYEAMAINSDNATTVALAELIAGTEGEFVKRMNEKGEEMGLSDFKFVNSTGLENTSLGENYPEGTDPDGTNLLSAKSAALLAYHLVNDFPESLEISNIPEIEFDGKTIRNWNWMLPHEASFLKPFFYEGVDGLKTGFTELAGYNFTGTAERGGHRLISVVMNTENEEARFEETAKLFDYGYKAFEATELFEAGYQVEGESSIPVEKGKEKQVSIALKDGFNLSIKKDEEELYDIEYNLDEDTLTAPIEKGEKVGTAKLIYKEGIDYESILPGDNEYVVDLITTENIEKRNWFMIFLSSIGDFFSNLYTTIVDSIKGWF